MITVNCIECGKPFEAQRTSAKFCSANCRVKWNSKPKKEDDQPEKSRTQSTASLESELKTILEANMALKAENKALLAKIEEISKDGLKTGNKTIVNDLTKPEVKGTAYNPNDNPRYKKKMGLN